MPWCPKCKNEYRAGVTVCADCNVELVDELASDPKENCDVLVVLEKEEDAKKLIAYLEYSSITAFCEYSAEAGGFAVYVAKKAYKQAKKAFAAFYTVETISAMQQEQEAAASGEAQESNSVEAHSDTSVNEATEDADDDDEDEYEEKPLSGNTGSYVTKAEKSADYRSSGFTFTFFGIAGLIVMVLHWLRVFQYFTTMSAVIMTIMFVAFIFIGIDSFRRAKKAAAESTDEEDFTKQLTAWLDENVTHEDLTAAHVADASMEINFLNELNQLKEIITKQFGALDNSFLDRFAEEYYNDHF